MGPRPNRFRGLWLAALLFAGTLFGGPLAAEPVKVRAWAVQDFGRLVFEWPREVSYEVGLRDGLLVITFSEPAEFDLAEVANDLSGYLGEARLVPEGSGVAFALRTPVDLRHFRDGLKVVIDLRGPPAEPPLNLLPLETAGADPVGATNLAGRTPANVLAPRTTSAVEAADLDYPALRLRVGDHPGFSRLVFDWSAPVEYRVEESAGRVLIGFERPARLDLSLFQKYGLTRVRGIELLTEEGGLRLALTTEGEIVVRHFLDGTHVVVDVYDARADASVVGDPNVVPAQTAPTPPVAETAVTDSSEEPATKPSSVAPVAVAIHPDQPEAPHMPATAPGIWPVFDRGKPSPVAAVAPTLDESGTVAGRVQPDANDLIPAPGRGLIADGPIRLTFDWTTAAPRAAVFRRGRHLWIVFDQRAADGLAARIARNAPELAPVERLSAEQDANTTILRLALPWSMVPSLRREGRSWYVDLRPDPDEPETDLSVEIESDTGGSRVLFRASGMADALRVRDPDLGDRLVIVPIPAPGLGLKIARSFPQFKALATYQGLVIAPLSDGLRIVTQSEGLSVSDSNGLLVSPSADRRRVAGAALEPETGIRLFDLDGWRRETLGTFAEVKQALLGAIVNVPPELVDVARLDLARFYFAQGLATETLSVLRLISQENQRLAIDPQVILLRAASLFLLNDYERAGETLREPALDGEWEAMVWQGASAAVARDWAQAVDRFTIAEPLIADYPSPVRGRLQLMAAEARLGIGDTGGASLFLEALRDDDPSVVEKAQLDYLEARRLAMDGLIPEARILWQTVAGGTHRASRARARLALIDLDREQGRLQPKQAIAELERLRFAWRGDDFELVMLQRLGELYAGQLDYQRALHSLRQATSYLSRSARSEAVAERMVELFVEVYLGDRAREIPPLTALALFEQFKELTPSGPEGDRVIEVLVDRLVEVDLLDEAAAMLENQVAYRLKGADKARVGARWAVVRLLDRKPELALEALEKSRPESGGRFLPPDLAQQRGRLRARALTGLGQNAEAIALLAGDDHPEALRLRAEILWRESDWDGAALALEMLLPEPSPDGETLARADGEIVRNLAVAYSLAERRLELLVLGEHYAQVMAETVWRDDFAMLTNGLSAGQIGTVADELADVARIQAFMTSYRERLQQASLSELN